MQATLRKISWAFLTIILITTTVTAADGQIHGVVADTAGKPVRGAMVKATAGIETVTRFTQADGRYEITLPSGSYELSVEAYGFRPKKLSKDVSQQGDTNFTLTPGFDVARLTSAEMQTLLPDDKPTNAIVGACIMCHNFGNIRLKAGFTASDWKGFIPVMPAGKLPPPSFNPATMTVLTQALEKDFGPDAPYFSPDADPPKPEQVTHLEIPDAALNATFREYPVPMGTEGMAHSILIDKHGDAWFSEAGLRANKIVRFEIGPKKFDEYPAHRPHTGVEGKDGLIWVTLSGGPPDLESVDPETGIVATYSFSSGRGLGTHTPAVDSHGNIWICGNSVWEFDVKTKQFKEYNVPLPATYPANSVYAMYVPAGSPRSLDSSGTFYDIKVDSKDKVWVSAFAFGSLIRIDPLTGETKEFQAPNTPSIRAIDIDAQDNIWFAGFNAYNLGKLDPRTGTFKFYRPPTRYSMPYGVTADKKTGNIWVSDVNGNKITRFDQRTELFTEFPIPTNNAIPKFMDLDKQGHLWFTEYIAGKIGVLDPGDKSK